jgi:hypothetical protein
MVGLDCYFPTSGQAPCDEDNAAAIAGLVRAGHTTASCCPATRS